MHDVRHILNSAAWHALRAAGDVEPNPMVGAAVVRDGRVIGLGHHRRFGGLHAEREALADCRRRGEDPRGATVYVTLEPCCHHGKQPPCTDALVEAGVARVIYARPDPHHLSCGGADVLRRAGIPCELSAESPLATRLSDPFVKRVTTGLPWVIAKWAQTIDGRLVTGPDEPRWISNEYSRARVHRLRARVDAIVTGIGTVLADDPLLTARGVRRVRRVARRVVLDPRGELPPGCRLLQSMREGAVVLVRAGEQGPGERAASGAGMSAGGPAATGTGAAEILHVPGEGGLLDLAAVLRLLVDRYDATNVMLECGPRLLRAFFGAGLVDEALVYAAPLRPGAGSAHAPPSAPGASELAGLGLGLVRSKPLAGDVELWYRRLRPPG
ncbi:MAG TPA: bifunctional diaminohydroxyphosphoribosylaminopyrimidine deaminase/5-amino-6-(5-phosphoribosylamino)uracil reductase RibD [Phycisphaerales bacterium]|nr:bifunctional diaminohydroxyphosphoribosylaminopyrimidine deaminase/5-amino-6-(5-phosphoribosylamino)uracil reductase RibD [Phycisphaerales bacterium]